MSVLLSKGGGLEKGRAGARAGPQEMHPRTGPGQVCSGGCSTNAWGPPGPARLPLQRHRGPCSRPGPSACPRSVGSAPCNMPGFAGARSPRPAQAAVWRRRRWRGGGPNPARCGGGSGFGLRRPLDTPCAARRADTQARRPPEAGAWHDHAAAVGESEGKGSTSPTPALSNQCHPSMAKQRSQASCHRGSTRTPSHAPPGSPVIQQVCDQQIGGGGHVPARIC